MALLFTSETLPTSSEQAIREFDERYLAGISAVQPPTWATDIGGDVVPVGAPRVTFPMSFLSVRYLETRDTAGRFKTLGEKSFDVKVAEYDAGIEAKLMDLFLNVFAYAKWSDGPSRLIMAEQQHVLNNIATLLEDTAQTSPWDDLSFFNAAHKANPADGSSTTWSNLQATPADVLDVTKIRDEITAMKDVRDENGQKMQVNPTIIMVPTAKATGLKFVLAQNMIIIPGATSASQTNPYQSTFTVVENPQLTDVNDWYLIDPAMMQAQGVPPWIAARFMPPDTLGLRTWDESSDFFKESGKIKIGSHIWYGFKLLFPHAIRKVVGA